MNTNKVTGLSLQYKPHDVYSNNLPMTSEPFFMTKHFWTFEIHITFLKWIILNFFFEKCEEINLLKFLSYNFKNERKNILKKVLWIYTWANYSYNPS